MVRMKSKLKDIAEIIGISSLIGFTAVTTGMAVISGGALIYFWEPNKMIWATEICMGVYGVITGFARICRICGF